MKLKLSLYRNTTLRIRSWKCVGLVMEKYVVCIMFNCSLCIKLYFFMFTHFYNSIFTTPSPHLLIYSTVARFVFKLQRFSLKYDSKFLEISLSKHDCCIDELMTGLA